MPFLGARRSPPTLLFALLLGCSGVWVSRAAAAQEAGRPAATFESLMKDPMLRNWRGFLPFARRARLNSDEVNQEQARADQLARQHWSLTGGTLTSDGLGGVLATAREYADFELSLEWRQKKGGEAWLYLRGQPAIQIWDRPSGSGGVFSGAGSFQRPKLAADKLVGEWNQLQVKMQGDRLTVQINGQVITTQDRLPRDGDPQLPPAITGAIGLDQRSESVEFRDVKVRELTQAPGAGALVNVTLDRAKLIDALRLLSASGDVSIILPDSAVGNRVIAFLNLVDKPVEIAIAAVCRAAGVEFKRDADGTYIITAKPTG